MLLPTKSAEDYTARDIKGKSILKHLIKIVIKIPNNKKCFSI